MTQSCVSPYLLTDLSASYLDYVLAGGGGSGWGSHGIDMIQSCVKSLLMN